MKPVTPSIGAVRRESGRRSLAACVGFLTLLPWLAAGWTQAAGSYQPKPDDPYFEKFNPRLAPEPGPVLLRAGDRLAIIGDSITEQKMYSRIIETYLSVCAPELEISVRQYGWSGETAEGFRRRMDQDCLRFGPTVATLCYGMNDSRYRPYDDLNGEWYEENYSAIVRSLKSAGARVVLGSPGCVSKLASWVKLRSGTLDEHNLNLCTLRDIALGIAAREEVRFADVFWTMFQSGFEGNRRHATHPEDPYMIGGKDGVHPGWAGHLVMAYCFLRAMGLDGEIGVLTFDSRAGRATATPGHRVDSISDGQITVTSTRYPFCAEGPIESDNSIRSGMSLVPFNAELNRLILVVRNGSDGDSWVIWGGITNRYSAVQLAAGVNLAADYPVNPFSEAFRAVDEAVAAKQAYETTQIKKVFHGPEGRADIEAAVRRTEAERAPLAAAIREARVPVVHTIRIQSIP